MAAKYTPLKPAQVGVLRWIAAGCPDGVMEDVTYKTTAAALQNRNLVRISKPHGRWQATVLPGGQYYLEHGDYDPIVVASYDELMSVGQPGTQQPRTTQSAKSRPLPEAVAGVEGKQVKAVRRAEPTANGGTKPPASDSSAEKSEPLRLHPAVRLLRGNSAISHVSKDQQGRALRLLQGLATGLSAVVSPSKHENPSPPDTFPPSDRERGLIFFDAGARRVGVDVRQHQTRSLHQPTKKELDDSARFHYTAYPKYDFTPNERLHIVLHGASPDNWEALQRVALEDRLEDILEAIERASVTAREAAERRRHQDDERRLQWENARNAAVLKLIESHRAEVLLSQLAAWKQSEDLGKYLASMERRVSDMPSEAERLDANDWLDWARSYRLSLDPLAGPLHMPTPPEPKPDALKPLMKGWNPYGPERGYS
ncbi:hypothetical protein [Arthrobacter sp. MW3 TE3886]|uniref:hypothetical protein n=1 Tax=Arthrobacter sp. MW3 TE3886 TaxID=3156254 RepID=UPI0035180926